ncbi:putative reverse transcriptase domain-containing protein [Tanacetum coccineum]
MCSKVTKAEGNDGMEIIMVNVIPPDHDHDVPVVEPNQHDDVPVVPEPVLEDEDEDPEEDEFEEEEDPQEDEDDMEIDIEEDENEPELTYPYEEVDPLNPPSPASESEPNNEIEVENPIEHEDETVLVSVYEVGESSTAAIPRKDGDILLPGFMRQDIDSLFSRMVNFSRRLCGRKTAHDPSWHLNPTSLASESEHDDEIEVENPIEHEDETVLVSVYEVGESSTAAIPREDGDRLLLGFMRRDIDSLFGRMLILDMGNEVRSSVEQGTAAMEKLVEKLENVEEKVECKKLKKELKKARLSNTFLQRPNEAINVPIEDEKSPLSEPQANVRNDASGSGPVRGAVELRRWFKKTESVFEISECAKVKKTEMKQLMTTEFCSIEEIQRMEHELWNLRVKEYDIVAYTQRFNELALMCPRMVEPERVKVDAYIRGLTDNIKGEMTSSKPADLNEVVRVAHKLMEQNSQARNERILEGKKRKWESLQGGNSSGKGNQKDNSRQTLQNNQKQGNARAMVTAPTDGKLPLCERCFTRHVGQCTIKCHKCGKVGHKARNRCPNKVKQEEVGEVRGRAYAIKDAEPKGPNVVTGTFLLNNRYASVLFDSGSDRSFVNTRFSSLLDIKPIKIEDSYEVELADGRVVSTNTVLKGCTLSLVNHIFEIDLMPIELGTFDVIIDMDWLVKHDAVIVCDEKVVRIPYESKTLIVEGDKGGSRLKIISCIKARKYVEQGCHLFLAHVTKKKSKEKQMEDVPVIRDFPEVFPEELPGLLPPRQVEF